MSTATISRKSTSRATVRRLLVEWQNLHSRQRSLLNQMADLETRIGNCIDLSQPVQLGDVCDSFAEAILDPSSEIDDPAAWLESALDAAGV